MNEKLKEIIKQAGVFYSYQDQVWELTNGDLEKFAELIVQECANLHDFNSGYYDDNNEWCAYYDKILKHFGVQP